MHLLLTLLLLLGPAQWTTTCTGLTCDFDGGASTGAIKSYTWSWGDGTPTTKGKTARHSFAAPGTYAVKLVVYDSVTKKYPQLTKKVVVTAPAVITGPETFAELPRVLVNTTMPAMSGRILPARTAAEFTTALSTAVGGDVIELANGVRYTGNFTLPATPASSGWIVIRPADQRTLPAPGHRMTPAIAAAANLPVLVSPTNLGAIATQPGAHHWRLIGIEVTSSVASTGLIRLGDPSTVQNTLASVPHDLILDRVYVHGGPNLAARRCVALNSAMSAVIDSYLSSCVDKGSDAQAIWGSNGPGPFKITNNYLEGSGENIMFGGADPAIPNLVPSDIEIRGNHVVKLLTWKGVWTVKNLFESKNSKRVLVEGNIFDGNWQDAQGGTAINLKVANQDGTCTWCTTQDLTFRLNIVRNVGAGITIVGTDPGVSVHTQRVSITDNLIYHINVPPYDGDGRGLMIGSDPTDATIAHNTILAPTGYGILFAGGGMPVRLSIRDNVMGGGAYGVKGSGIAAGTVTLTTFNALQGFASNVIPLADASGYPARNWYPASVAALGLSTDYRLPAGSSYAGKATDQRNPGANIDAVLAATASVIVP